MPHITLAEHDIQAESVAQIMARFFTREVLWEIPIDNLAIIWDTGTSYVAKMATTSAEAQ